MKAADAELGWRSLVRMTGGVSMLGVGGLASLKLRHESAGKALVDRSFVVQVRALTNYG